MTEQPETRTRLIGILKQLEQDPSLEEDLEFLNKLLEAIQCDVLNLRAAKDQDGFYDVWNDVNKR